MRVTDINKNDVLGDGGSVQYNGSGTLTLNNATIIGGAATVNGQSGNYGIGTSISNLTINLIGENTVAAYGHVSNSCGIYSSGSIAIKEDSSNSGSLAAIGGTVNSGTGYGIYAATAIDYQSGLMIAKGEKATNTTEKDSAAPLTGAWKTDTKFAVWGPTSTYKVITGPSTIGLDLTSGTHDSKILDADGYTWYGDILTLKNVIINVPTDTSSTLYGLQLPANAGVKLEGINIINTGNAHGANNSYAVYSVGALAIENSGAAIGTLYALAGRSDTGKGCGIVASGLTVNSGNIVAIGGKYTYSGISAGIQTASAAAITGGKVVAISNSSNSHGYGIRSDNPIAISGGTTIAAGQTNSIFPAPDMSDYTGSASSGDSLYFKIGVKSTMPASASTTVAKTSATQSSISFTLTTYSTGADGGSVCPAHIQHTA